MKCYGCGRRADVTRLRLARWIYPWWTENDIDAAKWRAHIRRREMGFVRCVEVDDDEVAPAAGKIGEHCV